MIEAKEIRFVATEGTGEVSALLLRPPDARLLYLFGHGAGAGMRHRFMEDISAGLADLGIATLRYQFPYMEAERKRPDPQPRLLATVRSAVRCASEVAGDLPLFAGGKSMGGRMTSLAASKEELPAVRGLVFFGFPLHAPNRVGRERAEHLQSVALPLLFLQGTRDSLARLEHLQPVCEGLGDRATLHIVEGGDHSFHVLKRSGRSPEEVRSELLTTTDGWTRRVLG